MFKITLTIAAIAFVVMAAMTPHAQALAPCVG